MPETVRDVSAAESPSAGPPVAGLQLGAHLTSGGCRFTLCSRHATGVTLLLYDDDVPRPAAEVPLDPVRDRVGDLWTVFVPRIKAGQLYAYKVSGPADLSAGMRFNGDVVLLDPYARAYTSNLPTGDGRHSRYHGPDDRRPKSVVVRDSFNWKGVRPPRHALKDSIIYEVHPRGFTRSPSAAVKKPGTYAGFLEKIDHLKDLGVTAVELLPVHEYDPLENHRHNPETGARLTNYWGYSTVGFFAPCGYYCFGDKPGDPVREFKTLVRELHAAGIEVILDVVYNHTAEGNHQGPTLHYKGIDNPIYYYLEPDGKHYTDYTGCGNTVSCNHPVVSDMILESLKYWVTRMHVDGFRFDLASVLSRDRSGRVRPTTAILERISEDPVLRDTKIVAEAWDAAGAYQVGQFPGRWAEWNGRYRDDVRQFWRGDAGKTGALATRLTGSSDLYQHSGRRPYHSINFVTSHDGFPLADLTRYDRKHNEANGEDNRDGDDHNHSHNYGREGDTDHPPTRRVRSRQVRNMLATLLLSQGVPMILGGDEFGRTQGGNNNAYCQDNEISWFDWSLVEADAGLLRFAKTLIAFRRAHPVLRRGSFLHGKPLPGRARADVTWFGCDGKSKRWKHDDGTLMCELDGASLDADYPEEHERADVDVLMMFNAGDVSRCFRLPPGTHVDRPWRLLANTSCPAPHDVHPEGAGPQARAGSLFPLVARSLACWYR